jgi:hypothetical protein
MVVLFAGQLAVLMVVSLVGLMAECSD